MRIASKKNNLPILVNIKSARNSRNALWRQRYYHGNLWKLGACSHGSGKSCFRPMAFSVEVIDVQTLIPFDIGHRIAESVKRTNRTVILDEGFGGASAYMLQNYRGTGAFRWLDSPPVTIASKEHARLMVAMAITSANRIPTMCLMLFIIWWEKATRANFLYCIKMLFLWASKWACYFNRIMTFRA